jgi:hypothetical protein
MRIAPIRTPVLRHGIGALAALVAALVVAGAAQTASRARPAEKSTLLPAGTLRGPIDRLRQYPKLSLATPKQRTAAARLLRAVRDGVWRWRDPARAQLEGFSTARNRVRPASAPGWYHAENGIFARDGRILDPERPEVIIYANARGRPLTLIGVMFSVPRGVHGPTPGGPITRWHRHRVCANGNHRGLAPRADGSCPPGTRMRLGSEMLHVWLTRDLRSAYAVRPPEPELCAAGLIPQSACGAPIRGPAHHHHGR